MAELPATWGSYCMWILAEDDEMLANSKEDRRDHRGAPHGRMDSYCMGRSWTSVVVGGLLEKIIYLAGGWARAGARRAAGRLTSPDFPNNFSSGCRARPGQQEHTVWRRSSARPYDLSHRLRRHENIHTVWDVGPSHSKPPHQHRRHGRHRRSTYRMIGDVRSFGCSPLPDSWSD